MFRAILDSAHIFEHILLIEYRDNGGYMLN